MIRQESATSLSIAKKTISVGNKPDAILEYYGKIYVANSGWGLDSTVFVLDPVAQVVIDTFFTSPGPVDIQIVNDNLYVLSLIYSSDWTPFTTVEVINMNTKSRNPIFQMEKSNTLDLVKKDDDLYFICNGTLYRIDTNTNTITTDLQLENVNDILSNAYALAIDKISGDFYITTSDFVNPGMLYRFDDSGAMVDSVDVGINAGYIGFLR
jgi:DNA-binding beta-propeller fold protein YncE